MNTIPETFECSGCGETYKTQKSGGTGYGMTPDGSKVCYACCTVRDINTMKTATKFSGYVSSDGRELQTWAGGKLGTLSIGKLHHWSRERHHVRARDLHGNAWYGTGAPGMYCVLRRCK